MFGLKADKIHVEEVVFKPDMLSISNSLIRRCGYHLQIKNSCTCIITLHNMKETNIKYITINTPKVKIKECQLQPLKKDF